MIATTLQNKGAVFLELDLSKVAGWRAAPDFYGEQMKMISGTVDLRATQVAQATAATLGDRNERKISYDQCAGKFCNARIRRTRGCSGARPRYEGAH